MACYSYKIQRVSYLWRGVFNIICMTSIWPGLPASPVVAVVPAALVPKNCICRGYNSEIFVCFQIGNRKFFENFAQEQIADFFPHPTGWNSSSVKAGEHIACARLAPFNQLFNFDKQKTIQLTWLVRKNESFYLEPVYYFCSGVLTVIHKQASLHFGGLSIQYNADRYRGVVCVDGIFTVLY